MRGQVQRCVWTRDEVIGPGKERRFRSNATEPWRLLLQGDERSSYTDPDFRFVLLPVLFFVTGASEPATIFFSL